MTDINAGGEIGIRQKLAGIGNRFKQGPQGDLVASELHGRLYTANVEGVLFSDGMGLTSINNATFTTGTLGATCTPIVGAWNPLGSGVNLEILQAVLGVTMTALQATGPGPYVWATATGQSALTLGSAPLNRKTLTAAGSQAKGLAGIALTGLVGNLVVRNAAALGGGSAFGAAFLQTAAGAVPQLITNLDNVDGAIIVPPGGVLALLATATPVAHSAASALLWGEVQAS